MKNFLKLSFFRRKSNHGFSLIQVLAASGILIVISLAFVSMTVNQQKSLSANNFYWAVDTELRALDFALSEPFICIKNLHPSVTLESIRTSKIIKFETLFYVDKEKFDLTKQPLIMTAELHNPKENDPPSQHIQKARFEISDFREINKLRYIAEFKARITARGDIAGPKEIFRNLTLALNFNSDGSLYTCSTSKIADDLVDGDNRFWPRRCNLSQLRLQFPLPEKSSWELPSLFIPLGEDSPSLSKSTNIVCAPLQKALKEGYRPVNRLTYEYLKERRLPVRETSLEGSTHRSAKNAPWILYSAKAPPEADFASFYTSVPLESESLGGNDSTTEASSAMNSIGGYFGLPGEFEPCIERVPSGSKLVVMVRDRSGKQVRSIAGGLVYNVLDNKMEPHIGDKTVGTCIDGKMNLRSHPL